MRTRLKALSLCLAVLIAFAALPVTAAAVAQRSVQLDAQRVEIDLAVGTTHKLTGAVLPEGASQKMTWRSSNKNVATVSSAAGLITARAVGRATVSARPATRGTWTRATVVVTDSLSPPASR
jgi:hypothetical protein